ncbi:MAG: hypothetical protein IJ188_05520 [Clostridia bacterium]|nr:hypothetical protein [Clostridia bacterium]
MSFILEILKLLGVSSVISAIVVWFLQRLLKSRDLKQEELRLQNEAMEKQNQAIMQGLQAILRDRLLQGYRHYLEKGYADYEDRENLENIWAQYHALGANGVMDDLRERFRALPPFPPES